MSLKDIKIPAQASDQQTTDAKSALPPVEFRVARAGNVNAISISDRQGVQNRLPTASYRVYFLPVQYAPFSSGTTTTVAAPVVYDTATRAAGRKVASLVTEIAAPGLGTVLNYYDNTNVNQAGYYFCAAVNRAGVEAPPEHMVSTEGIQDVGVGNGIGTSGGGGGGGSPIVVAITSINGDATPAQTLTAGTNMTITDNGVGGHTFDATGGGGFTKEDSSTAVDGVATVFTFSTAVAVNDVIVADGLVMDETFGDYTRGGVTVTFTLAPISTVQRIF
jgi:hypothetical protein